MTAIYWRNLEKRWQNGETESQKNGGVRQAHPPKIFIWITAWKSGGKDSGIRAEKNCFLLALSDGAEYKPYKRLWLLLCFVPSDNIAEGKSDFFSALILLCAVLEADQWQKNLFLFIKILFGSGLLEVLANRKLVHHFLHTYKRVAGNRRRSMWNCSTKL